MKEENEESKLSQEEILEEKKVVSTNESEEVKKEEKKEEGNETETKPDENEIVSEETKEKEQTTINAEVVKEKSKNILGKILSFCKTNIKKIVLILIIIILAIAVIDIAYLSPKEAVQKFVSSIDNCNSEKALSYIDWIGYYTYNYCIDDEDDFWDTYKDNLDDEDFIEIEEEYSDQGDDYYEDIDYELDDDEISYKIQEVRSIEKVADHLYTVKVKIKATDSDGDSESDTITFVVMKSGLTSSIVSMGDMEYLLY